MAELRGCLGGVAPGNLVEDQFHRGAYRNGQCCVDGGTSGVCVRSVAVLGSRYALSDLPGGDDDSDPGNDYSELHHHYPIEPGGYVCWDCVDSTSAILRGVFNSAVLYEPADRTGGCGEDRWVQPSTNSCADIYST